MNLKKTWLAAPVAVALALTACASGAGSQTSGAASGEAPAASTGIITTNGSEPQNPLIPGMTNETGGGKILNLIFAGLVYYDAKGETHLEDAESIETTDSTKWTVKLKKDRKFSDGTPVLAKNYVEAWKSISVGQQLSAYFMHDIVGTDDEGNAVEGEEFGAKVIDDHTFEVTLKAPAGDWPSRLGYSAFVPLPDSTLADPKTGGEKPVGNGMYKLASDTAWEHNVQIELVPNPEYKGDRVAKNGGVTIKFYDSQDAAYADLTSDNLDVLDAIPDSAFSNYEEELAGRSVNQAAAIFQAFIIPSRLPHFGGEEGNLRRQAISYAINREEITNTIFAGTRSPAKDFTSPVVAGFNDKLAGAEVLSFNADKAKELWAQADAISKWEGTFKLAYNSDGGHQAWVDAVVNQIKNTLGIDAEGAPYPDFKSLRSEVSDRTIQTAFRSGWQADYPGKFNFLAPLYGTGAGSNDGDYSNKEVDDLFRKAATSSDVEEGIAALDAAQEILLKELPSIPLWNSNVNGGYSTLVDNVVFGWDSVAIYHQITKK